MAGTRRVPGRKVRRLPDRRPGREGARHEILCLGRDRDEQQRKRHLDVVEGAFARGRGRRAEATQHRATVTAARKMMTSEQLKAFDVTKEPLAIQKMYGDTPFGRACLAARRLTEVGVRCIEVTLGGWDTHVNNHALHAKGVASPSSIRA